MRKKFITFFFNSAMYDVKADFYFVFVVCILFLRVMERYDTSTSIY